MRSYSSWGTRQHCAMEVGAYMRTYFLTYLHTYLTFLTRLSLFSAVPGGAPEDFTAIGLTSTSVQLKWDAPARKLRHGEIVLYEVLYHRADNALDDFAVNATDTSVVVDGLDVNTDYNFRLRAYTVKGSGPWTSRLPFKTFANRQYHLPSFSYLRH